MSESTLPPRRALIGALLGLALLAGCVAPTAQDRALFQMFWLPPQDLLARARLPAGLGVETPPVLIMTLRQSPAHPPRQATFHLSPVATQSAPARLPAFDLDRRDYQRFRTFQDRVIASIGPTASISVRLDIAYCAEAGVAPGMGPPIAEVVDSQKDTLLMTSPAAADARALYPTLPPC